METTMPDLMSLWTAKKWPGIPRAIDIPDESLLEALERAATTWPDRVAIDFMAQATTYRELWDAVARGASALEGYGIRKGDRVAISLPNCTSHMVAFYAVLRLGAIVVEVNPTLSASEIEFEMDDSGAVLLLAWEHALERLGPSPEGRPFVSIAVDLSADLPKIKQLALRLPIKKARHTRAQLCSDALPEVPRWHRLVGAAAPLDPADPRPRSEDVALLQYTGGTTGTPKAAVLTHRNVVANALMGEVWTGVKPGTEVVYGVLPFFHAFGMMLCLVYSVRIGATLVAFPKFSASEVLAAQKRRPGTFLPAVPPMLDKIADAAEAAGADMSSFAVSLSGAMALPPETASRWEALTGGMVVEGYGMTESSPVAVGNPLSSARRPGTLGIPFPSTEVRIVDPEDTSRDVPRGESGELLVHGPQVFQGYWNRPEETASQLLPGGWLRTGDIVQVGPSGHIALVDRIKEIIITGGFNVYPSQVEDRLREMPGVRDVAVVGLPGGRMGEDVVAAIVVEEGHALPDLAAVREWCGAKLAKYALPGRIVILPELPRSQIGKVLRRVVRAGLLAAAPSA
jgi:long-chain acyl-CoA synthetase